MLGCIPKCRTIPGSVLFGWIRFPHTWQENTPSKIFTRTKEVLVQNRNLYPSGCSWIGEEIPLKYASTISSAIIVQIFCVGCKNISSVGFKSSSWLLLELWHDIHYSSCAIHIHIQSSIGLLHISVLRSSNLINLSSQGICSMCFLPQLRSLQKCLFEAMIVYVGHISMCKTHTSMDV